MIKGRMKWFNMLAVAMFILSLQFPAPWANARETSSTQSSWEFHLIPYFWMAGLNGDTPFKGNDSKVDASFSDIWDNLDIGALVHFEAQKEKWGFFLDTNYLKLSADAYVNDPNVGRVDASLKVKQWVIDFGGLYRFGRWSLGSTQDREMTLELLGGGRYWDLKTELDLNAPLAGLGANVKVSEDWIDPFIGLRLRADLTPKLSLSLRGDIGGFGVGSDFSWNASAIFGYSFSEMISLYFGYRTLGVDYEDGSGPDKFAYDVTMSGPIVGLAFEF